MKIVIGTKIKEQRQQHEWSQQTVAERLRLTANYFQVGVREKLSRFRVVGSTEQTICCLDG